MNQTQRNFIINALEDAKWNLLRTTMFFDTPEAKEFIAKELASGKHKLNEEAFFKNGAPYARDLFPTFYEVLNKKSTEHFRKEEARVAKLRPKIEAKFRELKTRIMLGPVGVEDLASILEEFKQVAK